MIEIAQPISIVRDALSATKELKEVASGARDARTRRALNETAQALRDIYFSPRGVRAILSALASGDASPQEESLSHLREFNDAEWRVRARVREIEFDSTASSDRLSLKTRRLLDQISYNKISLRRKIQETVNEALTFGGRVPCEQIEELINGIDELNSAIEDLEEAIMRATFR